MSGAFLSAEAAAAELGVGLPTLYAYVSRGMIRSEPVPGSRRRRYAADDVRALKSGRGPDPESLGAPALAPGTPLAFGLPVLDSGITLIADGALYYRGVPALDLARSGTLEEVASLLWAVEGDPFALDADPYPGLPTLPDSLDFAERAMALLAIAQGFDPAAFTFTPQALAKTGARIMKLLTAIAAKRPFSRQPIHQVLADSWAAGELGAERLIRTALVLLADHELNVSAFTLRCAMSARSPLHAAIGAALAALQGPRHGGMVSKALAFLDEMAPDHTDMALIDQLKMRLKRGDSLPGFGHVLYPQGDPRATFLLATLAEVQPSHPWLVRGLAIARAVEAVEGPKPNIDYALALLGKVLNLKPGYGVALFATARAAGWIAHALEQAERPDVIRPRARYVGPPPRT